MSQTNQTLKSMHERGMRFLEARREMLPESQQEQIAWAELAKLDGERPAKMLRDQFAEQFAMDKLDYLHTVRFAAAVETIVGNCGQDVRELLLDGKQTAAGIMSLSRTSDTRQRYRVDGVREGRFRSVAPQNTDFVFDTVAFSEVPSRLGRGRGTLGQLHTELNGVSNTVRDESRRLTALCRDAASVLSSFVDARSQSRVTIPITLHKSNVLPMINNRKVSGKVTGLARQALRLTIKSVWDFPEMCERGILPTEAERQRTIDETETIIPIADKIL